MLLYDPYPGATDRALTTINEGNAKYPEREQAWLDALNTEMERRRGKPDPAPEEVLELHAEQEPPF